jgi:hypothetical protein
MSSPILMRQTNAKLIHHLSEVQGQMAVENLVLPCFG